MIILFSKSQMALFDMPINIAAHVRSDGTVVKPHVRIMKVAQKPTPAVQHNLFADEAKPKTTKNTKLDTFIKKHGGEAALLSVISGMTDAQKQALFVAMAKLDGITPDDVATRLSSSKPVAQVAAPVDDLFSMPAKIIDEVKKPSEHKYAMVNRPVSIGTAPTGFSLVEPRPAKGEPHYDMARNGIVTYPRRLTDAETKQYEMSHIVTPVDFSEYADIVANSMKDYREQYLELANEDPAYFKKKVFSDLSDESKGYAPSISDHDAFVELVKQKLASPVEALPDVPDTNVANMPNEDNAQLKIVEHVTGRGKTLRGIIRTDLTLEQAKEIDKYTFRKDGGYFIREKHLSDVAPTPKAEVSTSANNSESKNVSELPFGVPAGITKGKRREINAAAAALAMSGKELSSDDLALLRQYSGNGGCGDSLNEFYTDKDVANAMWHVIGKLGVKSGTVFEPSCATGVFLHTAPENYKVTGVEMDSTSATIAELLHSDRHEIINSSLERFATTSGDRQFSAVLGNAPFGLRGSLIKDHKSDLKTAEGYFLDTSLDKTEAGGIVAMIVPTGVMDSRSARTVRQRLLCKGEFLGAVRMPNTAFEHSHTGVTTDIVYFRKRPDDVAGALLALDKTKLKKLGVWDDEYLSGAYFEGRGAPSIFGTMEAGWRAKAGMGQDITVSGSMIGVAASVAAWEPDDFKTETPSVMQVLAICGDDEKLKRKVMAGAVRQDNFAGEAGDTKVEDGVTYILQGKPLRWHRLDEFTQTDSVTAAQQLAQDIEAAVQGGSSEGLAQRVNDYVSTHGIPANNKNLLIAASQDRVLYRLIGAVSADGTLSDVVAGRTRKIEGSLDTAAQSLSAEHENGLFSVEELAVRMGKDDDEVEDMLFASSAYAYAGDGKWSPMEKYLTGELWPKVDSLKTEISRGELREGLASKYDLQLKKLIDTIDEKSLEDVDVSINTAFLPVGVIEAYFNETKAKSDSQWVRDSKDVQIIYKDAWYTVEGGDYKVQAHLEKYLNRDGVRKDDMHIIEDWNTDFKDWLLTSNYRDQVELLYNRTFRGFVQAEYSDETINIPGMNQEGLKQYQFSGLRWALAAGKGIIAADVGLGKTVRGLMLARMAKVNGTAKRPTFVVPKSVLANWVAEAEKWFPASRVLVVGETYTRDKDGNLKSKSDNAAERNRKLHEMTQNDYDFVFISQPAFNDIDLDPIIKGEYVNDDFWVQRGDKKGNDGDKKLRKIREAYDQAIANREFQKRTDAVYWDNLGIDMMIVDEGHGYKNLYAAKNRFGDTPKFLGGQGQSNRAFDMSMKARYLREHNDGKGVFLLTATPTKNSPLEIYSMLSHIAPEAFESIGIRNSEEFLDRFCTFVQDDVLTTSGTIQQSLVTSGFKNLDELREIMRRFIDRKTAADVGLSLPTRNDKMHLIDMSDKQEEVYSQLRQDMIDSATSKDASGDSHVFSIMDKMGKASMDLELLDEDLYAGEVSPKYVEAAKKIVSGAKEGGQVVFAESVKSHQKLLEALVKAGIKREHIGIINAAEAESSAKRQNIADAFNSGKLKVVIGNTATMGEGINLQKATTDIHHLDLPWDPASMQQRNGRGLRQGNINESVRIHTYLSKKSFDGYRYQSMMAKKDWQDMLWNGGDTVENLGRAGKFDRSDLMIMMSADPEAEREKFNNDKAAATQRFDTEKRREVSVAFKRIQLMQHSLTQLKPNTEGATKLKAKLEIAKTKLSGNKHFIAKEALNSKTPTILDPDTGLAIKAGIGLKITEKDGTDAKWVVSSVEPVSGDIVVRRWGEIGTAGKDMTISVSKFSNGITPYVFDKDEEAAHVKAAFEEQAKANLTSLKNWNDIKAMPSSVISANNDIIQKQIKEGVQKYSFDFANRDNVTMVNKETGALESFASYEHGKKHDTHDYFLPTEENNKKAIDAWIEAEKGTSISSEHQSMSRGKSRQVAKKVYKNTSYNSRYENPFKSILADMSPTKEWGKPSLMEVKAKQRMVTEQMDEIRHAKTIKSAISAIFPLAEVEGSQESYGASSHIAKYPEKALATLWARARHLKALNSPMIDGMGTAHNGYAAGHFATGTVHNALVAMAIASGHNDLADAMLASGIKHNPDNNHGETVSVLGRGYGHSKKRLEFLLHHSDKAGLTDMHLNQLRSYGLSGALQNQKYRLDINDTLGNTIKEKMIEADRKEAA